MTPLGPIGVFDSGVGGLSVLRHLRELVPQRDVVYAADTAWCPYGLKPAQVVRQRAELITRALLDRGAIEIVVACNTASTVALAHLRRRFPDVPFVGMEPAVKPAAAQTQTGAVGVLATATTAKGEALARLVDRFGRGVAIHVAVPEGLVELVEHGRGDSPEADALLCPIIDGFAAHSVDVVVLGCTHYPFARGAIERATGPGVAVIDPGPAVARQAVRVWDALSPPARRERACREDDREHGQAVDAGTMRGPIHQAGEGTGHLTFLTSGDADSLRAAVERLMPAGWAAGARYASLTNEGR